MSNWEMLVNSLGLSVNRKGWLVNSSGRLESRKDWWENRMVRSVSSWDLLVNSSDWLVNTGVRWVNAHMKDLLVNSSENWGMAY